MSMRLSKRQYMPVKFAAKMAVLLGLLVGFASLPTTSIAFEFKPYKEREFRYRKPLEVKDGGDFLRVPYDVRRDINKRDEIPVRKVKSYFVSKRPKRHEQDTAIVANGRTVTHFAVGQLGGGATMTVIFLHGRDGSRHLGFDDERFGGNFNRVKNLLFRNGGIYVSADFADFKEAGKRDVEALVDHYGGLTTGKVVIACGSMGSFVCWNLIRDRSAANKIGGYVFLGGFPPPEFLAGGKLTKPPNNAPIYFAHGSIDAVYPWTDSYKYYQALRKAHPGYPIKYALFDTGKHGTPVRMIDWRLALNWIAAQ